MSEAGTPDPPEPGRVPAPRRTEARALSASEVHDILRRASNSAVPALTGPLDGPTVTDLIEAAREVGLDPDAVRRAAAVVPLQVTGTTDWITGASTKAAVSAALESPPSDWSYIPDAAQKILGRRGDLVRKSNRDVIWRENHGLGRTTVSTTRTGLHVEVDHTGHFFIQWFGGLVAWAAASSALSLALPPVAAAGLFLATPILLARPFWKRSAAKSEKKAEEFAMELLRQSESNVP